jgi:multiple sugar transport system substrate-binding protein
MISRKLNRRRLAKGTVGLAAAGAMSTRFAVPMINAQEKAPVLVWTTHSSEDFDAIQKIVDEFNAQSENSEVTLEQVPGTETDATKLITAVRGGTGPDVYMLDRFTVAERAANGMLQDLTELLTNLDVDPDLTQTYIEFAAQEAMFQGNPYALPFDADARALYVNLDMMEEAGADTSIFDAANGPTTWDALKEAAAMVNMESGSGDIFEQVGFVPWFNQGWHYTYGFSWGADFFDEENCEVTPNSEEMIAASQWVADYAAEFGPSRLAAFVQMNPGAPPTESPWIQRRLAALVTGDWQIAQNANYIPDTNYAITYIPVPEEGMESATWAGGWSWVIPQGAKEPEAAAEFMIYAAGEPGQRVYTVDTTHLPTYSALMDQDDLYTEEHRFFAQELLPVAHSRPPLPVGAKYWDELTAAWEKIYLGEQDPESALQEAKDNTMTLLSPLCPIN